MTSLEVRRSPHRSDLVVMTAAKTVSNTALRWIGPFLPTLERAFATTTGTLTGVMGVCELGGLATIATGRLLDRGRERQVFVAGLLAVAVSSVVALIGTVTSFAVAFLLLILGVGNLTVAGHAWIGHRVPFAARGRSIGVFETSWAVALLVGAPIIAVLIAWFGWRGPFVALAVASAVSAASVHRFVADGSGRAPHEDRSTARLPGSAWYPLLASASIAAAGLGLFVVSGAWLDDAHGVSTGGLGVIAAMFGALELVSSGSVAGFGDRIGSRRSVLIGLGVLLAGHVGILSSGDSRTAAVVGLLIFFAGFEFAFVSSLTLVTEAAPEARGRAIGISNACGTVARAGAVFGGGQLYEASGMTGTVALSASAAVVATVLTVLSAA